MKRSLVLFGIVTLLGLSSLVSAQDTNFEPDRQQIPGPDCLHTKDVWDAGSRICTPEDHDF